MVCTDWLWYVGLAFASLFAFKLLRSLWKGLYTCLLGDALGATVDWKKLPRWAVVTGCTDGIGKSYAKQLAAKKFNIVLISRNPEKLKTVAEEFEKKYSIQTKVIAVDFTQGAEIYNKIRRELENIEVGVLVNNVGISYRYAEYLTKVPDAEQYMEDLIRGNIISCTRMTQLVLPQMETRHKGVIINVSSLGALSPTPLLSVYSASKVYINFLSRALQEEYRNKGVIIQLVMPSFVSTNMSKMRPGFVTCTPDAFVRWAMKTVGIEDQTYGYPVHKLQGYVTEIMCLYLPETFTMSMNHRVTASIRKRYYKKFGLVDGDSKISSTKKE